jgi:DNA-binding LacI/PurR family transcriptional regulator
MPLVMVTSGEVPEGTLTADVDQFMGGRLAMNLLLRLGHERIGHAAGPVAYHHAQLRELAWRQGLAKAGLPLGPRVQCDFNAITGYRAAQALLREKELPTAIFAANDLVAMGLIHGFAEAGVSVPDDVSIVGFDDIPAAEQTTPPLTTIRQDFSDLGAAAVDILIDEVEKGEARSALIPAKLIVRETTAPPGR